MAKMILDFDAFTGVSHWVDTDETTGITSYGASMDADSLMEANKRLYNADHGRWEEFTWVAQIDPITYAEMVRTGKDKDQAWLRRWLNDPDHRGYRTRPGVI